jgi:hypothetical protein
MDMSKVSSEELFEVALGTGAHGIFEPLVVPGEALHQVFAQALVGPAPKLGAAVAANAEADGEGRSAGSV